VSFLFNYVVWSTRDITYLQHAHYQPLQLGYTHPAALCAPPHELGAVIRPQLVYRWCSLHDVNEKPYRSIEPIFAYLAYRKGSSSEHL
jgi:hypothetical protein